MLDGITILNQTEIMEHNTQLMLISAALMGASVVIGIFSGYSLLRDETMLTVITAPLMGLCLIISIVLFAIGIKGVPTGRYEYQVTIDDTVPMTKFYEQYELISVDGNVYTIREKE